MGRYPRRSFLRIFRRAVFREECTVCIRLQCDCLSDKLYPDPVHRDFLCIVCFKTDARCDAVWGNGEEHPLLVRIGICDAAPDPDLPADGRVEHCVTQSTVGVSVYLRAAAFMQ